MACRESRWASLIMTLAGCIHTDILHIPRATGLVLGELLSLGLASHVTKPFNTLKSFPRNKAPMKSVMAEMGMLLTCKMLLRD